MENVRIFCVLVIKVLMGLIALIKNAKNVAAPKWVAHSNIV